MEMDGDFSHNPDDIPRLVEAAEAGADLALGSRYCNGIRVINWPMNRLLLSTSAARYVRIITGMPFSDPTGGFKCFRRRALQSILGISNSFIGGGRIGSHVNQLLRPPPFDRFQLGPAGARTPGSERPRSLQPGT